MNSNNNNIPWLATHPGTILGYELEERKISEAEFASLIEIPLTYANELLAGKRPMTKAIADKIEEQFGLSAISLVNLQERYEHDRRCGAPA